MKMCNEHCHAVCDFCKFYVDENEDGEFSGYGCCSLTGEDTDASYMCKNFYCFRADKDELNQDKGQ